MISIITFFFFTGKSRAKSARKKTHRDDLERSARFRGGNEASVELHGNEGGGGGAESEHCCVCVVCVCVGKKIFDESVEALRAGCVLSCGERIRRFSCFPLFFSRETDREILVAKHGKNSQQAAKMPPRNKARKKQLGLLAFWVAGCTRERCGDRGGDRREWINLCRIIKRGRGVVEGGIGLTHTYVT